MILSINIPNAAVTDLAKAVAERRGAPVPSNASEAQALLEMACKDTLRGIYSDYKGSRAAAEANRTARLAAEGEIP